MKDEVLQKALVTDTTVIPRYDVVKPDGSKVAENVQLVLKNEVLTPGTPLNKQNLLSDDTSRAYGLDPATATPDTTLRAVRSSVSYCPRVRIDMVVGSTAHVKNMDSGEVQQYVIPATGYILADLLAYGTYNIWGVHGGVATTTKVLVVDTTKLYYVSIYNYICTWKFTVDAEVGATITVRHTDGLTFSGTVGADKTCSISLPMTGTYTAVGVYDGCNSESYTFTATAVTEGVTYTTSMKWPTATIYVTTGAIVTLMKDSVTRGGVSAGGSVKIWLPSTGTWSITATLGSDVTSGSIVVSSYQNYTHTLTFYVTYGIRIPLGNSSPTAAEYTDSAVGMSTGYTAWSSQKIFKDIKPCVVLNGVVQHYLNKNNLKQKEDGSASTTNVDVGDAMVEVPRCGYRIYTDSTYLYVKITNNPNATDFCYLAHSLDSVNDCDKIYYGAHLAYMYQNKLYSMSGMQPTVRITLADARTYAQARGTGYQLESFYPRVLLQCLYLIMYKNLNGQSAIGTGIYGQNSVGGSSTGGTNTKGPCYGATTGDQQMCFLNIEDFWGNFMQWVDGVCTNDAYNILTAFKDFNNVGTNYPYIHTTGLSAYTNGYMTVVQGTNNSGFTVKTAGGSETTYFCDNSALNKSSVLVVSNGWATPKGAGGPFAHVFTYDSAETYTGARIVYKHKEV